MFSTAKILRHTVTGNGACSNDIVERKKKSVMYMDIFAIHKEDKFKAICLTCNEKVSQGGNNPKHFNTTNFCKHLQSHSSEYKKTIEIKPLLNH